MTLVTSDGYLLGEIAHIVSITGAGPRYDPSVSVGDRVSSENLIALCPNHHRVVDLEPEVYTTEWLRKARAEHEVQVAKSTITIPRVTPLLPKELSTFASALQTWRENRNNPDEEFWQTVFTEHPHLIAQAVPGCVLQIGQKCYVGGKGIHNSGGNIVDFLYVIQSTSNLVVVEIKTPTTKLMGGLYRNNAYAISENLTGAVVQCLNYRDQSLKNYYQLTGESGGAFSAFNPMCLIIAGNVASECDDFNKKRSLELFRSTLQPVVLGYDELFAKVENLVDILG